VTTFIVGILAKSLNERASGLAYLWGAYLVSSGVPVNVISVMNTVGVSVSYNSLNMWFHDVYRKRKQEISSTVRVFIHFTS